MAKEPFSKREALTWIRANPGASSADLAACATWARSSAHRFKLQAEEEGLLVPNGGTPHDVPETQAVQGELLPGAIASGTVSRNGRPPEKATLFAEFQEAYPDRVGGQRWAEAKSGYAARLRQGHTHEQIMEGLARYTDYLEAEDAVGSKYVMMAKTFVSTNRSFMETWQTKGRKKSPMNIGRL